MILSYYHHLLKLNNYLTLRFHIFLNNLVIILNKLVIILNKLVIFLNNLVKFLVFLCRGGLPVLKVGWMNPCIGDSFKSGQ